MQGLLSTFANKIGGLSTPQKLGLFSAGSAFSSGQSPAQAMQTGLGTFQNFQNVAEARKRKEMLSKLVSEGGFTEQEQALILASQNPAAVAAQVRAAKQSRADAAAARAAAAAKPTPAQQRATLADQYGLTGAEKRNYVLTGNLPKVDEPKYAQAADGYYYYTTGPQKGARVFPDALKPSGADDRTALIQNFEFFKSIKPGASNEEVMQFLKKGNTFNLGPDVQINGDYAVVKDDNAEGGVRFVVIPGSKTDLQQQAAAGRKTKIETAEQAAAEAQATSGTLVLEEINRAIKAIKENPLLTTGVGAQITSNIGGTPAANVQALLAPIQANIGFDRLQRMRDESPTGGALGQVAVKELEFLQSVQGSLVQTQSAPQLLENLNRLSDQYKSSMLRVYNSALKDKQDGVVNTETGKVIDPLDYFSQGEIDMLTGKGQQQDTGVQLESGPALDNNFAAQVAAAKSTVDLTPLIIRNDLTEEQRTLLQKKLDEFQ
jgi:hypothetical protein